jgi:hypothetical protein
MFLPSAWLLALFVEGHYPSDTNVFEQLNLTFFFLFTVRLDANQSAISLVVAQ